MMVTFVSQCEKKALKKTRKVLDAFANRIGDNTWQTLITQDGLETVQGLLKKSASRSTAVSCHWIRSRSRSQLLWVVGNKNKFNQQGYVPVNRTEKDLLKKESSLNMGIVENLAAIAGFFHDIGKSTLLFQNKLEIDYAGLAYEALRHEWISLRLFQAFVGNKTDKEWLEALTKVNNSTENEIIHALDAYKDGLIKNIPNALRSLPAIARIVGWLIVSHHRLPQYPKKSNNQPSFENIELWQSIFEPCWNSPQIISETWSNQSMIDNWTFPYGTLFKSAFWQSHIAHLAERVLKSPRFFDNYWHDNLHIKHLARLSLMLADHAESSKKDVDNLLSDRNYLAYANTDKNEHGLKYKKQKLDEHNIKVGKLAYSIACDLPRLKNNLKALDTIKSLTKKVPKKLENEFGWQDKAATLAQSMKEDVKKYGFFGISMASTGKGKTRANVKIMHGLSEEDQCRFNVALGLRTLTIQTAKALKTDLFDEDPRSQKQADQNIALLVGSQAVIDLQGLSLTKKSSPEENNGSESRESLLKDEIDLIENLDCSALEQIDWLQHDSKIAKLLHAPILVSTIDYLIPATEGVRGGRQIAPMLRLLTSDLVLDEPDDFGISDLPALCRLVHWAGMLGSKVLLSTATISPSLAKHLFEAYQAGRKHFVLANNREDVSNAICCAWFDECNSPQQARVKTTEEFISKHVSYVEMRVKILEETSLPLRQGQLVKLNIAAYSTLSEAFTARIYQSITELHSQHCVQLSDKKVSIGLVRMANIDPLVHIAKQLFTVAAPENTRIHYCVYHGQYPLLQRSSIEQMLDKALTRHDQTKWEETSGIKERIEGTKEGHHIFVVIATSVAEVGRDHDYDWAVVEPSSMRSLIQLAGRIQRHRKQVPTCENIHILEQNYKGAKGKTPCFEKPGFETGKMQYASSHLSELNIQKQLSAINAIPRVVAPKVPELTKSEPRRFKTFSELEHFAQSLCLQGNTNNKSYAAQWWQQDVSWCGEIQRHQPFRQSGRNDDYCLHLTRENTLLFQKKQQGVYPVNYQNTDDIELQKSALLFGDRVQFWHQFDLNKAVNVLSDKFGDNEKYIMRVYTQISLNELDENTTQQWLYHVHLGVYKKLKKDI